MSQSKNSSSSPGSCVLNRILRETVRLKNNGETLLAVFDLDSTLFDLTLRIASIIESFTDEPANREKFPSECQALREIEILKTDWGLGEPLARLGFNLETHADFVREIQRFWASCFFSNDYLHHDTPLNGAVDYVQALAALGADIMYLTGRDVARMGEGTRRSLLDWNFPLDDQKAVLVLKPFAKLEDARFKLEVLRSVQDRYKRIWLFENEPVNLNLIARNCPDIGLVFIDSTHSGREQVADTLDRIDHFEVDLTEFMGKWNPKTGRE